MLHRDGSMRRKRNKRMEGVTRGYGVGGDGDRGEAAGGERSGSDGNDGKKFALTH